MERVNNGIICYSSDSGINCTASNLDGTKKIASASIISYGAV
jgi:hypothetical protein